MSGHRRVLVVLALSGLACGLGALALVLSNEQEREGTPFIVLALTLGWGFMGAGLLASWRRPGHRMGPLMTLVGFTWFLGALSESGSAWVFTLGAACSSLWIGAFFHMLVSFPGGRVGPGLERAVVRLGWSLALLQPLYLTVSADPNPDCARCPPNKLLLWDSAPAADALELVFGLATAVLFAGTCVVLVRRWRGSGPVQRRALAPVLWTGAVTAVVGVLALLAQGTGLTEVGGALVAALLVLVTAIPFAFLVGLLRSRLSHAGAVSALVERLGGVTVRDALAEALGDPSLALAYWLPRPGRYVDADGRPVELPAPGGDRAATEIECGGAPVAAIVHDAALCEEPALVRAAGAAAALALENERLDAELRARYDELRASRARLVAAGDAARRKLERDLHDGAQQRFVVLALKLRLARGGVPDDSPAATLLDEAMADLKLGLGELRELARGIHPAVLTERGLGPALDALAARCSVPATITSELETRLPPAVETAAYFVVAEALTNVSKYARAEGVDVTLRSSARGVAIDVRDDGVGGADPAAGTGLRGIADRVAALDGHVQLESPPGGGTRLRAEIPLPAPDRARGAGRAGPRPARPLVTP